MGKLRKLQERYLKGELTKAQYEAECKKLLDDEILDQDAYDDALDYDPDYERPKYSQADVDSTVAKKAVKMVRKALKDAGVTVEADDKTLLSKVAETVLLVKATAKGEAVLLSTKQNYLTLRLRRRKWTILQHSVRSCLSKTRCLRKPVSIIL